MNFTGIYFVTNLSRHGHILLIQMKVWLQTNGVMAKAQRVSSDYSSIDDLSLPRGTSATLCMEQHGPLVERCNSDSNLNLLSPQSWSSLSVDSTIFWLRGAGKTHDARVRVEWDIKEDVGAQDWIGLFYAGKNM